jgi:hypothetical protein
MAAEKGMDPCAQGVGPVAGQAPEEAGKTVKKRRSKGEERRVNDRSFSQHRSIRDKVQRASGGVVVDPETTFPPSPHAMHEQRALRVASGEWRVLGRAFGVAVNPQLATLKSELVSLVCHHVSRANVANRARGDMQHIPPPDERPHAAAFGDETARRWHSGALGCFTECPAAAADGLFSGEALTFLAGQRGSLEDLFRGQLWFYVGSFRRLFLDHSFPPQYLFRTEC